MGIEQLKQLSLSDLLDIDASKLTTEEVSYIEKRLVKEANRRISRLKKARKLSSAKLTRKERKGFKSFTTPKGYKPSKVGSTKLVSSTNKKKKPINVRNRKVKNVTEVQSFLKKKTTRVREINAQAERYKKVIRSTLGNDSINITDRQAKRIGRLMSKAEELAGLDPSTKKLSGSPRLLAIIVDIVKASKYVKNEDAEKIISEAITSGYEKAQELLNKLNDEDENGLDIIDDDTGAYN